MDKNLKGALFWLGKYIDNHPIDAGEWLTFSVNVLKQEKGIVKFTSPILTLGSFRPDMRQEDKDNVVILNEFKYD